MKITKRDANLLLLLLGILIFFGAYTGIKNSLNSKTNTINSEISTLEPRLSKLQEFSNNISKYQQDIGTIDKYIESELTRYPKDVRTEDLIMFARRLEQKVGIDISSISFTTPTILTQFDMVSSENEEGSIPSAVMTTSMSASCSMTYSQYKKLSDFLRNEKEHTTLENIDVSFNAETGALFGDFTLTKYFICSKDYEYKPTKVPNIALGTKNPFGTFTVTNPEEIPQNASEDEQ